MPEWRPETDVNSYTYRTGAKTCVPGSSREYDFTNMKVLGDEFIVPEKEALRTRTTVKKEHSFG